MSTKKMEIVDLPLEGAFYIKPFEQHDERGAFYKLFTEQLLMEKGVRPYFNEEFFSISHSGVVRGLHYQASPCTQAKLINCTRGEIYDVMVDIRKKSPAFGRWIAVTLSDKNNITVYVPRGFAHGFMVMSDVAYVHYRADNVYSPEHERGIMYNDAQLSIKWPKTTNLILSEKDKKWPALKNAELF